MGKEHWKPGNMVYPLPAVMVSCSDKKKNTNIITVAWTGTLCTNPAMVYVSIRPERHSYGMIKETKEFVINLTTKKLAHACDFCGVKSGRDLDKFKETGLHKGKAKELKYAPIIKESPVSIECQVKEIVELGSHHMFIGEVKNVQVEKAYFEEGGKFSLNKAGLITYSHGEYYTVGKPLGKFGFSVQKKRS
ncbi:flavin reductase (DIM6/NTAB) family NADH-FMN oxidoreductase RutF [Aequitasia blattaphilus]|uniref:Flavin reductase family protein n=1 Tax=Aequitasia blattaphilus TaxID=2949332 RepID=A0ABT1E638_9FIRM|nr:flavin reductase family protein [Aequitasia blattaphilus]MCP1101295.1 flavin reductase family protein [Aequitasia blattaphilus]MCR8613935.1 flavin reductase family protein [Aequitasia blattaphilus]